MSENQVIWHQHSITPKHREQLHGHQAAVLWFTGLSGSGKSTVAGLTEQLLYELNVSTFLLDGDNVRHGLCRDLSFTESDRKENIRRVGEVARLMSDAGLLVLTAFISPYQNERELVRQLVGSTRFIEIFVDTPLALCETRDPKGLYKKARAGEIRHFTGIDSPYQSPHMPDLHLDGQQNALELAHQVIALLCQRKFIPHGSW